MAVEFKHINHIMLLFEELHRHSRFYRKSIMNDYELFSAELTMKLEQMCDDYFGLHTREFKRYIEL